MTKSTAPKSAFYRLTTAGFQLAAIIGLFTFFGTKLDAHYQLKKPIWTVVLSLIGVGIGLYVVIKEVLSISNEE
ncbi:MAG: putative F0F1-ATPase subunit Ca2+/Mg2+ transporter [Bacteroidota bacterium]|jgi:F0F1-type ATP synthase assembly protein I